MIMTEQISPKIRKRRKDVIRFPNDSIGEKQEIGRVRHSLINIEEDTVTYYTGRNSLRFPFYTDCISIVKLKGDTTMAFVEVVGASLTASAIWALQKYTLRALALIFFWTSLNMEGVLQDTG